MEEVRLHRCLCAAWGSSNLINQQKNFMEVVLPGTSTQEIQLKCICFSQTACSSYRFLKPPLQIVVLELLSLGALRELPGMAMLVRNSFCECPSLCVKPALEPHQTQDSAPDTGFAATFTLPVHPGCLFPSISLDMDSHVPLLGKKHWIRSGHSSWSRDLKCLLCP